jgi:lipopolysaccharide export system permease protein
MRPVLGALDRYVMRAVLSGVAMVTAVLASLGALFLVIGQQNDIGVGNYTAASAAVFVLLSVPQQVWDLLPISALIGALLGLGNLARGSELTVMRAAGWSVWRVTRGVAAAGVVLLIVAIILGEWLAPPMQQLAKQQKTLQKMAGQGGGTLGASWVRDGRLLISIERRGGDGYGGVALFELDERNRLRSMAQASSIKFDQEGRWLLGQYAETTLASPTQVTVRRSISEPFLSDLNADFFGDAASAPDQMSTLSVWRIVMHLRANGLDDREPLFAFWSRIARTVAIFFALMLAVPFVFGSLRDSGSGARVAMGFILGIGFFSLQRTLESGAIVFGGAPMLLAWTPTLALATASLLLIMRTR